MALNAPYTPNTVISSTQVSNDLVGLANGSNDTSTNSMSTFRSEATFDFVASGGVWSGDSYGGTRNASMTAAVVYIGGVRLSIGAVSGRLFTASKDTYVDSNSSGVLVYTEVTNNAASPALAASSVRIAIIVTGATTIAAATSVNQGQETMILPIASSIAYSVTDSLGNLICPRDSTRKVLGYRQIIVDFTTTTVSSYVDATGLSCPVIVPTGRKVKISIVASSYDMSGGSPGLRHVAVRESSTVLGSGESQFASSNRGNVSCSTLTTPTVGSHTYKASVYQNSAGTFSVRTSDGVGNVVPAYILVELV